MAEKNDFTSNQVAALVEELKSDFRVVTEVVTTLSQDMGEVKDRLSSLETKVESLEVAVRLTVPRISKLEAKIK